MKTKYTYILCCLLLLSQSLLAQLSMKVDRNPVPAGERFKLDITLTNVDGNIIPPDMSDFKVVAGPMTSSQSSYATGRGSTKSITQSYFLVAKSEGTFTIPAAAAQTRKGKISSQPITLEVKTAAPVQSNGGSTPDSDCFMRAYASKSKVVVGEPVVITYMMYNRYGRFDIAQHGQMPQHSGFWKEDRVQEKLQWSDEIETFGQKQYRKIFMGTQILIPQRSGKLTLDPYQVVVSLGSRRSFFTNQEEIMSNAPRIDVSPLPSGKSAQFSNAVGDLDMQVQLSPKQVETNEAINLSIKISGTGNFPLMNEPVLDLPEEFEVYDPEIKDKTSATGSGLKGSRTFEYLIIPRYPGTYDLPPIEFQYYDLSDGRYRTASSGPLTLEITGDASNAATANGPVRRKGEITDLGEDIRYIHSSDQAMATDNGRLAGTWKHLGGVALPFLCLGLFLVYRKRQSELDADVVGSRRRKAGKVASKQLKEAKDLMDSGETSKFYSTLYTAMNDYAAQKLNLSRSAISKEQVAAALTTAGLETSKVTAWSRVLGDCEMAAYAPSAIRQPAELYREVSSLIEQIEEQL